MKILVIASPLKTDFVDCFEVFDCNRLIGRVIYVIGYTLECIPIDKRTLMKPQAFLMMTVVLALLSPLSARAQWGWQWGPLVSPGWGAGWNPGSGPRIQNTLGKVSISADFDYDGQVWAGEGREKKLIPPGLIVGTDEMAKISVSCVPSTAFLSQIGTPKVSMKFHKLSIILDVRGVDLGRKNGKFRSLDDELHKCGRVLIWADKDRKRLLLDSADPSKRRMMWPYAEVYPLPHLYVEGVQACRPGGAYIFTWELDDSNGQNCFQRFFGEPSVWDRMMLSVHPIGSKKPHVDVDPVWVRFSKAYQSDEPNSTAR